MRNKTYGIVALLVCATLGMTAAPFATATHTNNCSATASIGDDVEPVSGMTGHRIYAVDASDTGRTLRLFGAGASSNPLGVKFEVYGLVDGPQSVSCEKLGEGRWTAESAPVYAFAPTLDDVEASYWVLVTNEGSTGVDFSIQAPSP